MSLVPAIRSEKMPKVPPPSSRVVFAVAQKDVHPAPLQFKTQPWLFHRPIEILSKHLVYLGWSSNGQSSFESRLEVDYALRNLPDPQEYGICGCECRKFRLSLYGCRRHIDFSRIARTGDIHSSPPVLYSVSDMQTQQDKNYNAYTVTCLRLLSRLWHPSKPILQKWKNSSEGSWRMKHLWKWERGLQHS